MIYRQNLFFFWYFISTSSALYDQTLLLLTSLKGILFLDYSIYHFLDLRRVREFHLHELSQPWYVDSLPIPLTVVNVQRIEPCQQIFPASVVNLWIRNCQIDVSTRVKVKFKQQQQIFLFFQGKFGQADFIFRIFNVPFVFEVFQILEPQKWNRTDLGPVLSWFNQRIFRNIMAFLAQMHMEGWVFVGTKVINLSEWVEAMIQ